VRASGDDGISQARAIGTCALPYRSRCRRTSLTDSRRGSTSLHCNSSCLLVKIGHSARLQDRILTGSNGGVKRRTKKGVSASCNDSCSNAAQKLNEKYTKLLKDIEELNEEVDKFNNCATEDDEIDYSCNLQSTSCNALAEEVEEAEESVDVFACFEDTEEAQCE
jgi:hypothetical protein